MAKPPSSQGASMRKRLRNTKVLVVDYDQQIRALVKQVLENFGFQDITLAHNGQMAIDHIVEHDVDLLLTEWPMEPVDGEELVKFVRTSGKAPRPDIPIVMLTGRAEKDDVIEARDFGVNEFVVKPFTATNLSERLIQVIDNPRPFVICEDFVGPERRRKSSGNPEDDSRTPIEQLRKEGKKVGDKMVYMVNGKRVIVKEPNDTIKKQIGGDVSAEFILDADVITAAQEMIFEKGNEYLDWIAKDLKSMEGHFEKISANHDDDFELKAMAQTALTIKSQAGTFGFTLATAVAKLLYNYLAAEPKVNELVLTVIRKHIDTLYVILHEAITDGENTLGPEVVDGLGMLIDKVSQMQ